MDASAISRASQYDFLTELAPGVWKIGRKVDRFEFLSSDITGMFTDETGALLPLGSLLSPRDSDLFTPISRILNHENLISLIDWIQLASDHTSKYSDIPVRQYLLWDFCNAGTLENLMRPSQQVAMTRVEEEQAKILEEQRRERERETGPSRQLEGFQPVIPRGESETASFLPEGFCWHVLCSMLRALAWLHHGIRENYNFETKRWETFRADVDWQTILHRDICPVNIFFCHPQTKFETYGQCKLGNFSHAFISGHFNGILGDRLPPANGKVLGPDLADGSDDEDILDLDELRVADAKVKPSRPPKKGQPYTILSEYRHLADCILCMMIEPDADEPHHLLRVQTHRDKILHQAKYTGALKNMVHELYAKQKAEQGSTYNLYLQARSAQQDFMLLKPEGQDIITTDHLLLQQEVIMDNLVREGESKAAEVADIIKKQDNYYGPGPSGLLQEIADLCREVENFEH